MDRLYSQAGWKVPQEQFIFLLLNSTYLSFNFNFLTFVLLFDISVLDFVLHKNQTQSHKDTNFIVFKTYFRPYPNYIFIFRISCFVSSCLCVYLKMKFNPDDQSILHPTDPLHQHPSAWTCTQKSVGGRIHDSYWLSTRRQRSGWQFMGVGNSSKSPL